MAERRPTRRQKDLLKALGVSVNGSLKPQTREEATWLITRLLAERKYYRQPVDYVRRPRGRWT